MRAQGVLTQTRRHSHLVHLLGVRHIVLAVTKMDLVDYDQAVFDAPRRRLSRLRGRRSGSRRSPPSRPRASTATMSRPQSDAMPWYRRPRLARPSRNGRARQRRRRRAAVPAAGAARPAPRRQLPRLCRADRLGPHRGRRRGAHPAFGQDQHRSRGSCSATRTWREAQAGQSVTLTLTSEVDCSRGDVIAAAADPPEVADQFEASIVWMNEEPLLPGRGYWLKLATQTVSATIAAPKYALAVDTGEHLAAKTLELNDIGVAEVTTDRPLVFEPYADSRALGGFILVDKIDQRHGRRGDAPLRASPGAQHPLAGARRQPRGARPAEGPEARRPVVHRPSGAGKSTIANLVEKKLHAMGRHTFLLDGDNVRHGLNKDLGFTDADRIENVRRVGEVARLMADAGLIVITAFISPFRAERAMVRGDAARRRVHRNLRRYAAGRGRSARRQGPLRQGARRRAGQFHRHRQPL